MYLQYVFEMRRTHLKHLTTLVKRIRVGHVRHLALRIRRIHLWHVTTNFRRRPYNTLAT